MDSVTHKTGQLLSGTLERNKLGFVSDGGGKANKFYISILG